MFKKIMMTMCLLFGSTFAHSGEITWKEFILTAWNDDYFKTIAFQFRHTDSYKELKYAVNKEQKVKKAEIKDYFENNDPFALFLMAEFFKKNGKAKKHLSALERLYAYGTPYARYITAKQMIDVFADGELTALEGGYHLFFKNRHAESENDERKTQRYQSIVDKFGYKKVDQKMMEISERISEFEAVATSFEYKINLPPIEVQMLEDTPAEITVIKG